ncbi:MAG: flagellar M-ring protein FliF, partial [Treponema sp.]|nr:flagellar M-ring protein FliF [Treponema sp.]
MNEWLKKVTEGDKNMWSKWKPIQKVILIGIIVIVIVAIVASVRLSAKPATVRLFNAPVTDQSSLTQILDRLSQENVNAYTNDSGYISV